jgi:hypothetical protein
MNVIDQIDDQIDALKKRKAEIQQACSHPDKRSVNKGDDGNILTGREESYWTDHTCNLCGHKWTTSQKDQSYD